MKIRGIYNAFQVSLLKIFVEDVFERDPAPEPAVQFADARKNIRLKLYYPTANVVEKRSI